MGRWILVLQIPFRFRSPAAICHICIGFYSVRASTFYIGVVLLFGLIGYVLRLLRFELAPILIGFILGPMVEENLRRAMLIYRGDFFEIILRPISGTMLGDRKSVV